MGRAIRCARLGFLPFLLTVASLAAVADADSARLLSVNTHLGGDRAFLSWADTSVGQDAALYRLNCFTLTSAGDTTWVLRNAPYSYGSALLEHLTPRSTYYAYAVRRDAGGNDLWRTDTRSFSPVMASPASGLNVAIRSINTGAFPIITSYVTVADATNTPISDLTAGNFSATENGTPQTSLFSVIPPNAGGSTRVADIIFVIDDTGSMGPYIGGVVSSVIDFANRLTTSGVDFRLGLVTFKDYVTDYNGKATTADVGTFNGWVSGLYASGGGDTPEVSFDAIADAATWAVRPGAQRVLIMITDAPSHYLGDGTPYSSWTQSALIALLTDPSVQAQTNIVSFEYPQFTGPGSVTDATGGTFYHLGSDFSGIIAGIGNTIANQYIVQYQSSNPAFDGTDREVRITATRAADTGYDIAHYTPGAAPQIVLSTETASALGVAQVASAPVPVSVHVTDNVPPLVSSVTLRYRSASSGGSYGTVPMTNTGGDIYQADIPASAVATPGVSFYVEATDGVAASTLPLIDPSTHPLQFAVLPNEPPVITHTPIVSASLGVSIPVDAVVTDHTHFVNSVKLEYKSSSQFVYTVVAMTPGSADHYTASIPGSFVTAGGVNYAIRATDDLGISSLRGPYTVAVTSGPHLSWTDPDGPLPPCNFRSRNQAVVGSVRDLRWTVSPAGTPLDLAATRLRVDTGHGSYQETSLQSTKAIGGGRYSSQWIVPYNDWTAAKIQLIAETVSGLQVTTDLSDPLSTPTLNSLLGPSQVGGVLYSFTDGQVVGAASGAIFQIPKATLGTLCALNTIPSGTPLGAVDCDGVFVLNRDDLVPCKICLAGASSSAHLCLVSGGEFLTTWTQEASGRVQYVGYETDRTIQLDRRLGWTTPVAPAVALEAPSTPDEGGSPLILVNGWTEESDAWNGFAARFETLAHPAWELYYSSRECPAAEAGRLVAQGIQFVRKLLPDGQKVDLVAHSFGAMATRAYVQSVYGGTHYREDVHKVVFLNGVNHGTHVANDLLRQDFLTTVARSIADLFKCTDENDPMVRDMGVGSDFQSEIQASNLPDLGPGTPRFTQYLSIASDRVRCDMACLGQGESSMADGPVSVASASLLDKGVPLLIDGRHSHSEYQASADEEAARGILAFLSWTDPNEAGLGVALRGASAFGPSTRFIPTTEPAVLQNEGGISFSYRGTLDNLPPKKAEQRIHLIRVQPLSFGFLNPAVRWVRGDVQEYFEGRNGTGNDRYYSWGWCPSASDTKKKQCSTVFFDQGDRACLPYCALLGDAPSDEDVTILPGLYWLEVNGGRSTQVVVKPMQFRYEGDVSQPTAAIYAASPVDLLVTDPGGRRVGPSVNEIPGADYDQWSDEQGAHHALVRVPLDQAVDLEVQVSPITGATEPGVYSLFALSGGLVDTLTFESNVAQIPSEPFVARVAPPPPTPTGLVVRPGTASLELEWAPITGAAGYRVFYGYEHEDELFSGQSAAEGASGLDVAAKATSVALTCLADSVFRLAVAAVDSRGRQSAWSEEILAAPLRPAAHVKLTPRTLNLGSNGKYVNCELGLGPPFSISRVDLSSIMLGGTIPVVAKTSHLGFDAAWAESVITMKFDRQQVEAFFRNGGTQAVTVTGRYLGCADELTFEGRDTIRFIKPQVAKPISGENVATNTDYDIQWSLPPELKVDYVNILLSTDGGTTWTALASSVKGRTDFLWHTPTTLATGALIGLDAYSGGASLGRVIGPAFNLTSGVTGVGDGLAPPRTVYLSPPQPTPFQSNTTIQYGLPSAAPVRLEVFDVNGRLVATLVDGIQGPGNKSAVWTGATDQGEHVGAGIYLVRLQAGGITMTRRAVLRR